MTTKLYPRRSQVPGSSFNPSNEDLVNHYLRRRIERNKRCSFITNMDVYEKVPWRLEHVRDVRFEKNEWFYFVERKKQEGDSKRTSRTVGGKTGFTWKGNNRKTVKDGEGVMVGFVRNFTFQVHGKATGWSMDEFVLDKDGFEQPVVICRLKFHPTKENSRFAPKLQPRVIGHPPVEENNKRALDNALVVTPQQLNGSGEVVSASPARFMGQGSDSSVHGNSFGSYGLQRIPDPGKYYGQGIQNQTQVPMMIDQALNAPYSTQPGMMQHGHFGSSSDYFVGESSSHQPQWNGFSCSYSDQAMMHHHNFGTSGQFAGESSGLSPIEKQVSSSHQLNQGSLIGQQQWNGSSCPHSEQPYEQGMMESIGSSTPSLAQSLGPYSDLSVVPMDTTQDKVNENSDFDHNVFGPLPTQRQQVGQISNLSLTQQQQCDGYTGPSLAQSHAHQNNNNVERSEQEEDDFMNLTEEELNMKEEDLKHILSLPEDVWRNFINVSGVPSSELNEDELNGDDLKNLGLEDLEHIKNLGEDGWKYLISSQPPKRTYGS